LDFSQSDLDVEDERPSKMQAANRRLTKFTPGSISERKRKSEVVEAAEEQDEQDEQEQEEQMDAPEMADLQGKDFEELEQPDPLPNAANDDVRYDVEYEAPDDEPVYNDFIDDGAGEDFDAEQGDEDQAAAELNGIGARYEDRDEDDREEEVEEDDEDEELIRSPASSRKRSKAADDNAREVSAPPVKRGRGRPPKNANQKPAAKKAPARHKSLSPSRAASRTRDGRTQSPQREWREPITHADDSDDHENGVRRSTRVKVPPLAYWRGEKMVFGRGSRRKSIGGTLGLALPEVKEIIHVDLVEGEEKKRTRAVSKGRAEGKKKRRTRQIKEESSASEPDDDEEEEHIIVEANVRSFEEPDELVKKVLAIPQAMYDPRPVVGQGIFFQKTLAEEPHFAAGVLDIPVGEAKPIKPSKQNTMFFFIFQGYVQVKIHDNVFRLCKGGQFTVPRGNFYEIVNVGKKDARLFFSQSTDTLANANMVPQQRRR
jgi:centromere protein C